MDVDYAAILYKSYFRSLFKDVAKQYPDNSEDALELELKCIRENCEERNQGFLFDHIFNQSTYLRCLHNEVTAMVSARKGSMNLKYSSEVDFKSLREMGKDTNASEDVVWLLMMSMAKYPRGEDGNGKEDDRASYQKFEKLLSNISSSNGVGQLFYYKKGVFYFNALQDNGDIIYSQQNQNVFSHSHVMESKEEYLFKEALEQSNFYVMYDRLKELIRLYKKSDKEIDTQTVIQMAECLADLVPIIDRDSKLKRKEQLQKERTAVRYAVLNHFLLQGKSSNKKLEGSYPEGNRKKILENYMIVNMLMEKIFNGGNFEEECVLVIMEGYLDLMWRNLE